MIISHEHRYVFVENPQTASWAIRHELCECYGGIPVLHKHATFPELLQVAKGGEKDYFVFITVRNPLDVLVSRYFRYLTDHDKAYSDPQAVETNESDYSDRIKYRFIQENKADYPTYFLKFYTRPYSDLADLMTGRYNAVIHYENLQFDFEKVLDLLQLKPVRPIPLVNKTQGKRGQWTDYYPPATYSRAKKVAGPFMAKWGYSFPSDWGEYRPGLFSSLQFRLVTGVKNAYIYYLRNNNKGYARVVRRLRAGLIG
jgi:hypothetical protein